MIFAKCLNRKNGSGTFLMMFPREGGPVKAACQGLIPRRLMEARPGNVDVSGLEQVVSRPLLIPPLTILR